jgi:TolB-like protein/Flp pilus assembly protein TadD
MPTSIGPRIRFGPFEVDPQAGELRRMGSKVNLQGQPFQVLALLLERPGEMVTRDELCTKLWPADTFVDFERGLNKAVNKLRAALRDDPDKPRFIETLPLRGYRFIAPVESLQQAQPRHTPRIDSLAVLSLENLSGDPSQEFFSDGLTEELICALANISTLRLISRTSTAAFKGSRKSLPQIASELGVAAVVEGTVARSGQSVRVTVQLIFAADDSHIWAGRYERDLCDILKLQAEIAQSIASKIHKLVQPAESSRVQRTPRVDPGAYEACLMGTFLRDKLTPFDLEQSVKCLNQAIQLDPRYARGYGELSLAYFYLGLFGMGPPGDLFPKAKANAVRALELDETVACAHIGLASVHIFYDWDWAAAEFQIKQAMELRSGDSVTHAHYADFLSIRGHHSEAVEAYARVLELDPISRVYIGHFGLILHRARRYVESIAQCRKALAIDPQYVNALWFMALSLEQIGDLSGAIENLERASSLARGSHFIALLGRAYAIAGEKDKAVAILEELRGLSQQKYVSPFDIAVVHAGLGDRDAAFECLEDAYQQRVFRIIELTFPMFDDLRADRRWVDLVQRAGLSPHL